jgi:DNA-binding NarL/FixJ family response regulator
LIDSRPTVIFADDNVKVTRAACTLLNSKYNVVKTAVDGEEAIRCILDLKPDFAILDISMPKLDGISVARHLHKSAPATMVIFLTLIDDDDYMREARLVGHGYVLKRRLAFDLLTALLSASEGQFFCSQ